MRGESRTRLFSVSSIVVDPVNRFSFGSQYGIFSIGAGYGIFAAAPSNNDVANASPQQLAVPFNRLTGTLRIATGNAVV